MILLPPLERNNQEMRQSTPECINISMSTRNIVFLVIRLARVRGLSHMHFEYNICVCSLLGNYNLRSFAQILSSQETASS